MNKVNKVVRTLLDVENLAQWREQFVDECMKEKIRYYINQIDEGLELDRVTVRLRWRKRVCFAFVFTKRGDINPVVGTDSATSDIDIVYRNKRQTRIDRIKLSVVMSKNSSCVT